MENKVKQAFFGLIKGQVFENKPFRKLNESEAKECAVYAYRYDLMPIISSAILQSGIELSSKVRDKLIKEQMFSIVRHEQIIHDVKTIKQVLNDANVDFILLKGAYIRNLYDNPQFRTSCDIDILIRRSQIKAAKKALIKAGFKKQPNEIYVFKFISASGIGVDVHYSLKGGYNKAITDTLELAWDKAVKVNGNEYEYKFNLEFFMFYFLSHTQKHFNKGCGIKPFIDLKILNEKLEYDKDKLNELLKANGLLQFYDGLLALNEVWFNGAEHSELTLLMDEFIFDGGVYGSIENDVAVKRIKGKDKKGFVSQRLFLSFDELSGFYPNLAKHKWLMPFYQVKRWFKVFRKGKIKKTATELNVAKTVDEQKIEKTKKMMEKLNLND